MINREINKACAGFNFSERGGVATGNWGCGVFEGDRRLKFMIQWIACSLNGKKMKYCPYGSSYLF